MKNILILALIIFGTGLLSGCALFSSKENINALQIADSSVEKKFEKKSELLIVDDEGSTKFDSKILDDIVAANQKTELSEAEMLGIKFMLEEEKLARDVNAKFFEKWSKAIFDNISSSEHTHISAVRVLADKYDIDATFYDNGLGKFSNTHLLELYTNSITKGSSSTLEALKSAAEIEEVDILDLTKYQAETNNPDLKLIYENLLRGSRNHLRGFVRNILRQEQTYEAQKLSKEMFEGIVSSANEQGKNNY